MKAAWNGCLDVVGLLLDRGAQINHSGNGGWTALTFAASRGYKDNENVIRLLLERGADPQNRIAIDNTRKPS